MAGKISLVLNALLIIAVIWLFVRLDQVKEETRNATLAATTDTLNTQSGKDRPSQMAYINIDTLDANYQYLKDQQEKLQEQRKKVDQRVKNKMDQAEQRYQQLRQEAQTMSREEAKAAQKELQDLQTNVKEFRQRLYDELSQKQMDAQNALKRNLKAYLDSVNAGKEYSFILSYGTGSGVLLADDSLEITQRVLKGLNEQYEKSESAK